MKSNTRGRLRRSRMARVRSYRACSWYSLAAVSRRASLSPPVVRILCVCFFQCSGLAVGSSSRSGLAEGRKVWVSCMLFLETSSWYGYGGALQEGLAVASSRPDPANLN